MAKQRQVTIKHIDSDHIEKLSESEYNGLQPAIKEKYEIVSDESVEIPSEVSDKK